MSPTFVQRYCRYDELRQALQELATRHPGLLRLETVGRSYEGREIPLAVVTNAATGPDTEKPALWVDGNIHAAELAGSAACLYLLHRLTEGYGKDADITRCLDSRVFYVVPRLNPDGAEWALEKSPRIVRSSTRPYPYDEEPVEGLAVGDVDGDGRILLMRVPDANGPWKVCPREPRLMVRREPTETGGQYYRLMPEGRLGNYDGITIRPQAKKQRLDLNRNFPAMWRTEGEQKGSGPYPTSEPEVRAAVDFIMNHRNITSAVTFHTYSGVILRPYSHQPDDTFPFEDLRTYLKIGEQGARITGYPAVSVYDEFRYHPKEVITGAFDDWMYDHLGVFAWTVELWSPQRHAGITNYKFIDWYREHPVEDDLKLLRWSDQVLGGRGYVNWYPYTHPELGEVELGGWDSLYAFQNPPAQFLEKEISPFPEWLTWHLLISPRLELLQARSERLGEDVFLVRVVVQNTGWLPSYVAKKALERKAVRGVIGEIALPPGARLERGRLREEGGQLEGRAYTVSAPAGDWSELSGATDDRLKLEWLVRAPAGGAVDVTVRHERAGVVRARIELGAG